MFEDHLQTCDISDPCDNCHGSEQYVCCGNSLHDADIQYVQTRNVQAEQSVICFLVLCKKIVGESKNDTTFPENGMKTWPLKNVFLVWCQKLKQNRLEK